MHQSEWNNRSVCAALLLLVVLSASVQTLLAQETRKSGEIRGKITVLKAESDMPKTPMIDRYSTHRPSMMDSDNGEFPAVVYGLSERAVVYLEGESLNGQKFSPPTAHPILDQKGLAFHPQVLPILVGQTVEFPNRDNLFHNVFSYSSPKEFDLGRYPMGYSKFVTFDEPGVVRVYCDIHSHMNATILILQNPFFAVPDDQGSFSMKNVPNGTYTMRFWYGRELVSSQPVTIKAGEVVNVNFTH